MNGQIGARNMARTRAERESEKMGNQDREK